MSEETSALQAALDAALVIMRNGGPTAAAQNAFDDILKGFWQAEAPVVWRLEQVTATIGEGDRISSFSRPVGPLGRNLVRVAEASALSRRVAEGEVDATAFAVELRRIASLPPPYASWMIVSAAAAAGGFFTRILAADYGAFAVAAVAAALGQASVLRLRAWNVTGINATFICALLSALIGALGLRLGVCHAIPATLIGSVIYAVPGLSFVNGFLDLMRESYFSIGIQRLLHTALVFLELSIALAVADALL